MNVHVREIEEEWRLFAGILSEEANGFLDIPFRDSALVGLSLNDGLVSQEREGWILVLLPLYPHIVAVRDTVVAVETVSCR